MQHNGLRVVGQHAGSHLGGGRRLEPIGMHLLLQLSCPCRQVQLCNPVLSYPIVQPLPAIVIVAKDISRCSACLMCMCFLKLVCQVGEVVSRSSVGAMWVTIAPV
eukprot:1161580-Pelagomonas_calceolata.AAC.1